MSAKDCISHSFFLSQRNWSTLRSPVTRGLSFKFPMQLKLINKVVALVASTLLTTQVAMALPADKPEQKITAFLWSAPGSTAEKTELIYHDVKDNFTTKIAFTREKEFSRPDGTHGIWRFDEGKLVLTGLDTKDGFTIIFDDSTLGESRLSGHIPNGKWRGHRVILTIAPK